jgi:hypothetical protein
MLRSTGWAGAIKRTTYTPDRSPNSVLPHRSLQLEIRKGGRGSGIRSASFWFVQSTAADRDGKKPSYRFCQSLLRP